MKTPQISTHRPCFIRPANPFLSDRLSTSNDRQPDHFGRAKPKGSVLPRIALLVSTALFAMVSMAGPTTNPELSPQLSPEQLVHQTADQVLSKLRQDRSELKAHPGKIYDLVKNIILPHFDFDRMSEWVLGANWRRATPQQRSRFTAEFRDLLVNTYGYALLRYENEQIRYLPSHSDSSSGQVLVRTQIQQPDGEPIPVNYRLYDEQGEWKVFDLSIDGVSLVSNYRASFAEQLQQVGMDGLIKHLAQHNQETAGAG